MRVRRVILTAAVVTVAMLLTMLGARAHAADDSDIEQMLANAKTAADHEAIAKHYDQEAAHDREEAKRYQRLHAYYKRWPRMSTLSMHSSRMADFYKNAAEYAALMATEHRDIAKEPENK